MGATRTVQSEGLFDVPTTNGLRVSLARGPRELIAAQRLRYRVFADELGAALETPLPGIDIDPFDAYCDHLVVTDERTGDIVGTYRILPPERAAELGRYYAESEFDLRGLAPLRSGLGELGRSCVAPEYRGGAVVQLLWSGIARYLLEHDIPFLMGCASVDARDGGRYASCVYQRLLVEHGHFDAYPVQPHRPLPLASEIASSAIALPPLIKGYLRAGAVLCGPPAYDARFRTADLLLLLEVADLAPRYARHFLQGAVARPRIVPVETALA